MPSESALRRDTVQVREAPDALAVVACGLTRHQRAYLLDGLRRRASCQFIESYDDLDAALPSLARCDALVLALEDAAGRDARAVVERVTRDWPATAIVVYCPPRTERPLSIKALALAGAHQFVFEGVNDTAATLAQAVENARRECIADSVQSALLRLLPPALHSIADTVLSRPDNATSVERVASAMGVHRKTLVNRCGRSSFLKPAEVILWCRLAMVGRMLEHTGATVESIALTLGFPSHTSLRNFMKKYTGATATELRKSGGLAAVLAALERRIAHTVTAAQ